MRDAVEAGRTCALVSPDRMLTRQVTSALGVWGIRPDDSAGTPLQQTAPGRLMRLVAGLFVRPLTAEALLTVLKHPLCHAVAGRRDHLRRTRELELFIRKSGMPFPDAVTLRNWGQNAGFADWSDWVAGTFCGCHTTAPRPLAEWLPWHLDLAQRVCAGSVGPVPAPRAGPLWDKGGGADLLRMTDALADAAPLGGTMTAVDYTDLFAALLSREEQRESDTPHPQALIWGTIEARVMGPDLLILAGLNEGTWPETALADPWLNRRMRVLAGMLPPERRVGLSAHDFQQAANGPQVILSRALRSDDAETVPARWLNRVQNLLNGLPMRNGPQALAAMRARGDRWIGLVRAREATPRTDPAPRPAPVPPPHSLPTELAVTQVRSLIRDPYAVYARRVLNLKPLDPLQASPDALLRGDRFHKVFESFIRLTVTNPKALTRETLLQTAGQLFAEHVPWPVTRVVWLARLARLADVFVADEAARQAAATPTEFEQSGRSTIAGLGLTLTAKADRIDFDPQGRAHIFDYKGSLPSVAQLKTYEVQLPLEAAIMERAGFADRPPAPVARAAYIGIGSKPEICEVPLNEMPPGVVWDRFTELMTAYLAEGRGFAARLAPMKADETLDYDHLSRFGEWDASQPPLRIVLT